MKIFISAFFIILINISILRAKIIDRVVAVVNDDIITLSELNKASSQFLNDKNLNEFNKRIIKLKVLNELIDMKLLEQEAEKLNIEVSNREIDEWIEETKKRNSLDQEALEKAVKKEGLTFREYKEKVKENILRIKLMNRKIKPNIDIDDERLKSYYLENIDKYSHPERVKVKAIFLSLPKKKNKKDIEEVRTRAYEILNKIEEGKSFESMAVKYSESPSAKDGGDMGYFKIDDINPGFKKILNGMKPGEVSEPFMTENGFYIIKLVKIEKKGHRDFKEVKDEIYRAIINEESEKAFKKWLSSLREEAIIEIRF
jgi:peptidyl-prolyl cis-trans isomerase SurA